MTFSKTDSAGYLANHMARIFARDLTARIKPLGLTTGSFPALLELWEQDGLTQTQLTRRLDIEQATMANTLARMERDGLVTRKKDETDGRVQRIWLTPHGKSLHGPATRAAAAVNATALDSLSPAEHERLIALMQKIIATAQARATPD
ncbi:MAG TPA: MarR family transcriptional regulator [Rhodobacteraceae bacterium]|nr:MarR family transcriptional regulator [Paracoccaceae bacterium]